jgi:hypothetical protein
VPGPIKIENAAADFAASLVTAAELSEEEPSAAVQLGADPSDESGDAADDSDAAADAEAPADDADDAGDSDGSEESGEDDESVPDLSAVGKQILGGDLAGACKKLGIDPKIFKLNEPKFKAMREGLKEARTKETAAAAKAKEAETNLAQAQAVIAEGKKQYGHLIDLKHAIALGDFGVVKELLEELAPKGTTYQQIAEGIVLAAKGASPGEAAAKREAKRLREELAAREAAAEADKQKQAEEAASKALAAKNLAGAATRLKGTQFDGIDEAPAALVRIVSENWDYARKGLKIKPEECLKLLGQDPVISKLVKLKKLEAAKAPARDTASGQFRNRGAIGKKPPAPPPGNRPPPKVSREDEFKASIQEAARLEAAEERTARRGRR